VEAFQENKELPKFFCCLKRGIGMGLELITVRLTFLAQSVRMKPNFQGLLWLSVMGLVK
jgi:hypothetical protein